MAEQRDAVVTAGWACFWDAFLDESAAAGGRLAEAVCRRMLAVAGLTDVGMPVGFRLHPWWAGGSRAAYNRQTR